ncbi:MAG: hypothetical protein ABSA75_09045 [Candidatus Bathyarchaeia archaeon]|jgi:hypothetical protein
MSEAKLVTTALKSTPYIARLTVSLLWMYLTLGYRVSKTRKAFEKQLTAQGMSKQDAKLLSASYENLKNEITGALKLAVTLRN